MRPRARHSGPHTGRPDPDGLVAAAPLPVVEVRVEHDGIYYRTWPIQRRENRIPASEIVDCVDGRTAWPGSEVAVGWRLAAPHTLFGRSPGARVLCERGPPFVFHVPDRQAFVDAVQRALADDRSGPRSRDEL